MNTTIRFSVKLFLAACVLGAALGDAPRASAQDYTDPTEWSRSQLQTQLRTRTKDLLEVREKLAEVRDDIKTQRTASHDPQTRREYQALFQNKLQKLLREERRLVRELRAIRSAIQQRPLSHVPAGMPVVPALGAPIPRLPRRPPPP